MLVENPTGEQEYVSFLSHLGLTWTTQELGTVIGKGFFSKVFKAKRVPTSEVWGV